MEGKIFISYSSKDSKLANEIVKYLEDNNFVCWIAPRDISSGMDYTDLIDAALRDCAAMLLIVSTTSLESQWVKKEVTTAVSLNKNILPFLITQTEIKGGLQFLLNNVQWIDATKKPQAKFHEIIDGLNNESSPQQIDSIPKYRNNSLSRKMWIIISLLFVGVLLVAVLLHTQLENNQSKHKDSTGATDTLKITHHIDSSLAPQVSKPNETVVKHENVGKTSTVKTIGTENVETPSPSSSTSTTTTFPLPESKPQSNYQNRLGAIQSQLNKDGNFQKALKEFESLKNEYPENAAEIEKQINSCKKNIAQ